MVWFVTKQKSLHRTQMSLHDTGVGAQPLRVPCFFGERDARPRTPKLLLTLFSFGCCSEKGSKCNDSTRCDTTPTRCTHACYLLIHFMLMPIIRLLYHDSPFGYFWDSFLRSLLFFPSCLEPPFVPAFSSGLHLPPPPVLTLHPKSITPLYGALRLHTDCIFFILYYPTASHFFCFVSLLPPLTEVLIDSTRSASVRLPLPPHCCTVHRLSIIITTYSRIPGYSLTPLSSSLVLVPLSIVHHCLILFILTRRSRAGLVPVHIDADQVAIVVKS